MVVKFSQVDYTVNPDGFSRITYYPYRQDKHRTETSRVSAESLGRVNVTDISSQGEFTTMNPENPQETLNAKVLIVEDNEQNIELLQAYLEEIPGVTTSVAHHGLEAMEIVSRENPDLILLDIMMPKMSGYEVCKQLKGNPVTRDIPIMMITALNEPSDYERGMESGADDFVSRPVNRMEFLTRVRSLLRLRKCRGPM